MPQPAMYGTVESLDERPSGGSSMKRMLCALALAVAGLGLYAEAAVATPFQACFVFPHDSGCTRSITVQAGYHVKLKATADWHSGRRVSLF